MGDESREEARRWDQGPRCTGRECEEGSRAPLSTPTPHSDNRYSSPTAPNSTTTYIVAGAPLVRLVDEEVVRHHGDQCYRSRGNEHAGLLEAADDGACSGDFRRVLLHGPQSLLIRIYRNLSLTLTLTLSLSLSLSLSTPLLCSKSRNVLLPEKEPWSSGVASIFKMVTLVLSRNNERCFKADARQASTIRARSGFLSGQGQYHRRKPRHALLFGTQERGCAALLHPSSRASGLARVR